MMGHTDLMVVGERSRSDKGFKVKLGKTKARRLICYESSFLGFQNLDLLLVDGQKDCLLAADEFREPRAFQSHTALGHRIGGGDAPFGVTNENSGADGDQLVV